MPKLERMSLVDKICERLREEITSLKRAPGSKLNITEIQEELGVSGTPIREAFNRLQQEGLVKNKTNIGAFVITMEEKDIDDIVDLANTLRVAAIKFAMKKGNKDHLLQEMNEYYQKFLIAENEEDKVLAIHRFFGSFFGNADNARLLKAINDLKSQHLMVRNMAYRVYSGVEDNRMILESLIEAVTNNDKDTVETILDSYSTILRDAAKKYIQGK